MRRCATHVIRISSAQALPRRRQAGPTFLTLTKALVVRSKGGIAHLSGAKRSKVRAELGIDGLSTWDAFTRVTINITAALDAIGDLFERAAPNHDG